ncbi:MAG: hypothetical protein ABSC06_26395, partial [Rhodopila sp.]
PPKAPSMAGTRFGRFLRLARRAVLVTSPYAYQKASWLVPASLRGFARVALPSGMILHDVAIHIAGTTAWASPSSKAMLGRDGATMRDSSGKVRYVPVVSFASKETRDRFSMGVIEALRLAYPDVLAGEA